MREAKTRRLLEKARDETREELAALVERGLGEAQQESVQALSSYDNHPADAASDTFEREKDLGIADALRARLKAIEEAEDRLASGTYETCTDCGRPIGSERLEALPWTRLCIDCQEADETRSRALRHPRTLEEGIIAMPFGQNIEKGRDHVEFDGEDSWQAVTRYGTSSTPQDSPKARGVLGAYADAAENRSGIVESSDRIVDPNADTPGQAFPSLARRPGQSAYDPEDAEPPDEPTL